MRTLILAFSRYPRDGHSPLDAAKEHNRGILDMRGNVYGRLSSVLDKETRESYLKAAEDVTRLYDKNSGDIKCILNGLKKK